MINGMRTLLIGYERRTTENTLYYLQKNIIPKYVDAIVGVKLADWRINLDGGCVPISEKYIVCHPDSLVSGIILIERKKNVVNPVSFFCKNGFEIILVSKQSSIRQQACNILCLDKDNLAIYDLSKSTINAIKSKNRFKINTVSGQNLVKGRGGCRCMTRPIYL